MTETDIYELTGRKFDAAVAEYVMGWKEVRERPNRLSDCVGGDAWSGLDGRGLMSDLPRFGDDMNAAWQVVIASNTRLELFGPAWRGLWSASFAGHRIVQGETAAIAIGRAALIAMKDNPFVAPKR